MILSNIDIFKKCRYIIIDMTQRMDFLSWLFSDDDDVNGGGGGDTDDDDGDDDDSGGGNGDEDEDDDDATVGLSQMR